MNRDNPSRPPSGHLFAGLPRPESGEVFETLLETEGVRIERIVSSAHPDGTTYDQGWDEWVCLLQGEAELRVAGESVLLRAGDHLHLPAHTPHQVVRTSENPRCVWLAVHLPRAE